MLVDLVPDQIPWLFSGIVVRHDDIGARRDLLKRFLSASIEGNYIALTDEKRAKKVLAKRLKIDNAKILDITYNDFKAHRRRISNHRSRAHKTSSSSFPAPIRKLATISIQACSTR